MNLHSIHLLHNRIWILITREHIPLIAAIKGSADADPGFLRIIYQMPLLLALAALIADCAACLASGLAGCLALAAAALFQSVLKILCVQALYMFHGFRSSLFI